MKITLTRFLSLFFTLISSVSAQETTPDTTDSITVSYVDSLYVAFEQSAPTIHWDIIFWKLVWVLVTMVISYLIWRYMLRPAINIITDVETKRKKAYLITKLSVILSGFYVILVKVVEPTQLVLFLILAVIGLSFALASVSIVKDLISGFILAVFQSAKTGDTINYQGEMFKFVKPGLKSTVLEKTDGTLLIVPNHHITETDITKITNGRSIAQVDTYFYLPADIDLIKVKEIAQKAASLSRFVYLNEPIKLYFTNILKEGRSLLRLQVNAYVLNVDLCNDFRSDVTEAVISELLKKELITPGTSILSPANQSPISQS